MCGFAGIIYTDPNRQVNEESISCMISPVIHRGPDDSGIMIKGNLGFGFRRLSIIDLSESGHQPMSNESKTIFVMLNGEIYNFKSLRTECEETGYRFRSRSDTEVLIALYMIYGEECIKKLKGMFAIVLWDEKKQKLFLVRDRMGKKPLHYYFDGSQLLFGSEIKSILQNNNIDRSIDNHSVEEFFTFGFISAPKTIYRFIRKVKPGHTLSFINGIIDEMPYWKLSIPKPASVLEGEAAGIIEEKLDEAVKLRMISDVPLGAFLSGGIDSSLIVALMAGNSSVPVKTFSIGFSSEKYDETKFALAVAKRFGTEHHQETVQPDYKDIIEFLLADFDEPFGDSSALPTYVVSKLTRQHVTVALSGDGGDEIFGGYDHYEIALKELLFDRIPSFIKPGIGFLSNFYPLSLRGGNTLHRTSFKIPQRRYIERFKLMSDRERELLYSGHFRNMKNSYSVVFEKERFFEMVKDSDFMRQLQYNDVHHYMPDDIFVKVDRMSMLNSLEVRSPFIDHDLVEYAFTLPTNLMIKNGERKYLLKKILRKYLPEDLIRRPKQGFALPLRQWFSDDLYDFAREHLFSSSMKNCGIFNIPFIEWILKIHKSNRRDMSSQLWLLLAFSVWLNKNKFA